MNWRRHCLGLLGLLFLGIGLYQLGRANWSFAGLDAWVGSAFRMGVLLAALWLALPEIQQVLARVPAWLLVTVGIGGFVVLLRPKLLLVVIPIVGALLALQILGRALGIFRKP